MLADLRSFKRSKKAGIISFCFYTVHHSLL